MPVAITCPFCGKKLQASEAMLGKQVKCGSCQKIFVAAVSIEENDEGSLGLPSRRDSSGSNGKAIASLVLGIIGMVGWCLPILGLPITVVGLCLGVSGKSKREPGIAIAGIILNIIGLVFTIINAAIGAYLGATGQHPLVR